MHVLGHLDDDDGGTVFRDVIMLALLGFAAFVIMLLPHLNPPTTDAAAAEPPGNVLVEVRWADEVDADVDLWVEAPGDRPVGYSNKSGRLFNLLRDDLGHSNDATALNYEVAFSRGVRPGPYTVNLHLYRNRSGGLPIEATVVVRVKSDNDGPLRLVSEKQITLTSVGQELTVVRFDLDSRGRLVPNSVHTLPRALRAARKS